MLFIAAAAFAVAPVVHAKAHFSETLSVQNFYRGNLHAHTSVTDGDATPQAVVRWYKEHDYNFVSLTDYDRITQVKDLDDATFVTLAGDELASVAGANTPVHISAHCGKSQLVGIHEHRNVRETIAETVKRVKADGALTMLDHPNWEWAISSEDLVASDGFEMIEIASGHTEVLDQGDGSHPSEEALWDDYLTRKHQLFAAAVDNSHDYRHFSDTERNPGRAWIEAWAPALNAKALCEALRQGHFYSSRGSRITSLVVTPDSLELAVDGFNGSRDRVEFIGAGGKVLAKVTSSPARYALKGGERYVRARVVQPDPGFKPPEDTGGRRRNWPVGRREAWTQAYFVKE